MNPSTPPQGAARLPSETRPLPGRLSIRRLLPSAFAVLFALVAVPAAYHLSSAGRLSNLTVDSAFPDAYIMTSKGEPGRCYLVDRRSSTMRRDDASMPGRMQNCASFGPDAGSAIAPCWAVWSKRRGTVLFVPVERVPDWSYPFLYQHVRESFEIPHLPPVSWVDLYVNRVYQGLFLRMPLPRDPRKKDGGSGVLREILTVRGDRMTRVDTRFGERSSLFLDAMATGTFPDLVPPHPALAWLAARRPLPESTLLVDNKPPHAASLMPLPVSVETLFEWRYGRAPAPFIDDRLRRWLPSATRDASAKRQSPFNAEEEALLQKEFAEHWRDLEHALRAHAAVHRSPEPLRAEAARRSLASFAAGVPTGGGE